MRYLITLLLGFIAVVSAQPVDAVITDETFAQTARAVAQVRARHCPDGEATKAGSGFLFGGSDQLVTAFHVVAGCGRIDAYFERNRGSTVSARVERVLEEVDLALLRLDRAVGPPLPAAATPPEPNDQLEAIAFFFGSPTLDNKTLKVTFGSSRLRSMLPSPVSRVLAQSRVIDLDLEVVRLDGHLLPGASGAPLITADGSVAAVGSGGLKSGAASISWAVPASHLDALLTSQERPQARAGRPFGLFSTPYAERAPQQIQCGEIGFVPIGVRTFLELAISTDDPIGLNQLVTSAALPQRLLEQFEYRIYAPVDAGAAIAIPTWMRVERRGNICAAMSSSSLLSIEFGGAQVANPLMIQDVSVQFERRFMERHGRHWIPDVNYTYLAPLRRLDGLTVRRKAAIANGSRGSPTWVFETLMVKGDTFAAAIAINPDYDPARFRFCRSQPHHHRCNGIQDDLAKLAQTVLAVHLSTFPIF